MCVHTYLCVLKYVHTYIRIYLHTHCHTHSLTHTHTHTHYAQEQAARIERGKLELEAALAMAAQSVTEALAWQEVLREKKEKEEAELCQ